MKFGSLTLFLLAIVVNSSVFSQTSQDLNSNAAKAIAEHAQAMAKAIAEDSARAQEMNKQKDSKAVMRVDIATKIMSDPVIHKRYIRHLAVAILQCYEMKDSRPKFYGTEKYDQIKAKLVAQIGGGAPLGSLLAPGTSAYKASINRRADELAGWYSLESLSYASQMLDKPEATPIAVEWAAANFNLNLSCLGKSNEWETTPEDKVYMKIKRVLDY